MRTAQRPAPGESENMALHVMWKGQVKRLAGSDAQGQATFIASMFGTAALGKVLEALPRSKIISALIRGSLSGIGRGDHIFLSSITSPDPPQTGHVPVPPHLSQSTSKPPITATPTSTPAPLHALHSPSPPHAAQGFVTALSTSSIRGSHSRLQVGPRLLQPVHFKSTYQRKPSRPRSRSHPVLLSHSPQAAHSARRPSSFSLKRTAPAGGLESESLKVRFTFRGGVPCSTHNTEHLTPGVTRRASNLETMLPMRGAPTRGRVPAVVRHGPL